MCPTNRLLLVATTSCSANCPDRAIARVQSVHLMNAEQRQVAANLWTKPTDLARESASRLLVSTPTITIY